MEMFIMIFIITILLDVYMMVNDKFFPYNQTIVDRINKIVGVVGVSSNMHQSGQ